MTHFRYPSIQAKIWGNIGKVSELLDIVLDGFIKRSISGGLGSGEAEIMADTVSLKNQSFQKITMNSYCCLLGSRLSFS